MAAHPQSRKAVALEGQNFSRAPRHPAKQRGRRTAQSNKCISPIFHGSEDGVCTGPQGVQRLLQKVRGQGRAICSNQDCEFAGLQHTHKRTVHPDPKVAVGLAMQRHPVTPATAEEQRVTAVRRTPKLNRCQSGKCQIRDRGKDQLCVDIRGPVVTYGPRQACLHLARLRSARKNEYARLREAHGSSRRVIRPERRARMADMPVPEPARRESVFGRMRLHAVLTVNRPP